MCQIAKVVPSSNEDKLVLCIDNVPSREEVYYGMHFLLFATWGHHTQLLRQWLITRIRVQARQIACRLGRASPPCYPCRRGITESAKASKRVRLMRRGRNLVRACVKEEKEEKEEAW